MSENLMALLNRLLKIYCSLLLSEISSKGTVVCTFKLTVMFFKAACILYMLRTSVIASLTLNPDLVTTS